MITRRALLQGQIFGPGTDSRFPDELKKELKG
jgi:hypothetical protein